MHILSASLQLCFSLSLSLSLQYERTRKIRDLVSFLISVLDTPEKIHLLQEVRYTATFSPFALAHGHVV